MVGSFNHVTLQWNTTNCYCGYVVYNPYVWNEDTNMLIYVGLGGNQLILWRSEDAFFL